MKTSSIHISVIMPCSVSAFNYHGQYISSPQERCNATILFLKSVATPKASKWWQLEIVSFKSSSQPRQLRGSGIWPYSVDERYLEKLLYLFLTTASWSKTEKKKCVISSCTSLISMTHRATITATNNDFIPIILYYIHCCIDCVKFYYVVHSDIDCTSERPGRGIPLLLLSRRRFWGRFSCSESRVLGQRMVYAVQIVKENVWCRAIQIK